MKEAIGWLLMRISGFMLVFCMVIHLSVMHYGLRIPWYGSFKFIFLLSVIYHGYYGMRDIAIEYVSSAKALFFVRAIILISASLLLAAGTYIVLQ